MKFNGPDVMGLLSIRQLTSLGIINLILKKTKLGPPSPFPHGMLLHILCNGWEHYIPYRCLQISNKLCDSTLCTCGGVQGGWRNRCIMLIMPLDSSWRQTLRLPPPGIEPGSPASQAGTLPKELSRQHITTSRIRDVYPRSRILIFSHPGSWIQNSHKREG